jgi:hypothetical protein
MGPIVRAGVAGAACVLGLCGALRAEGGGDETVGELRARVAELERRLAAVESPQDGTWLTEARAAEVRRLVEELLADADGRASLLARGVTAGYDDGFVLASDDGNWLLRTNFLMQQRFVINSQEDDTLWGFENTRSRFTLSGNVVSPEWFYRVQIDVGANGGGLPANQPAPGLPADRRSGTLDAYAGYDFGNGVRVWGGSFKDRFLREDIIDAADQQAVERSLVSYVFTTGRVDGIEVEYTGERVRVWGGYNDGARTGESRFSTPDARFGFTVRGEYLFAGSWDQFEDLTSPRGDQRGILAGAAIHYQTEDDGAPDLDLVALTADGSFEFGGANVYAALMYESRDSAGGSVDMFGLVVQGGYYFTDSWEAFGRLEWADLDTADDIVILTAGVSKYLDGTRLRWTTDVGIGFERVTLAPPVSGFLVDGPGDDGQIVIRTQLQLAF